MRDKIAGATMFRNKFLSFFSAIFLVTYCFNSVVYAVLLSMGLKPFGTLYRMFLYHYEHPYQFILIFTIILALCAAIFIKFFNKWKGWKKYAGIAGTFAVAFIISCMAGGILWKLYDMQAGFTPKGWQFWSDLVWGLWAGLAVGWQVVLYSFPYNLIVLAGDVAAVFFFYKPSRFTQWKDIGHS
jgi:hypothetical protein